VSDADLVFLPWVRRGAAAGLLTPDTFGASQAGLATASASLQVNAGQPISVPVTVMGPGHVTGIDSRQVVRMDPAPGSRSFEPNYFPLVELDEPGLPWLFTPAAAGAQARLRPWLCLVVVRVQDGVQLLAPRAGALPVLRIAGPASPAAELPDLAASWAWAHAQVTSAGSASEAGLLGQLASNPERSVARLLCSRVLDPDTDYLACVVPAFELGRQAGLGLDVSSDDEAHLAAAWDLAAPAVELPVYHSWAFATGAGGDFQSLAMLLRARPLPPGIGVKLIDVSDSGLAVPVPAGTTLPLAGALVPVGSAAGGWASPAAQATWEAALSAVLNAPAAVAAAQDPLLAPPLYGAAQAGRPALDAAQPSRWFEQLNLAPAHRAVAHLGARVVQDRQDELMASAWAQAAELARVNQLLRQAELGGRVSGSLHARHVARMDAAAGLQVLAPAQARMTRTAAGAGLAAALHQTGLDPAAFATALRRVARPRGAINRRVQRVVPSPVPLPRTTGVLRSLQPAAVIARRLPPPTGRVSLESVAASMTPARSDITWAEGTSAAVAAAPPRPWFAFVPLGTPVPVRPPPPHLPPPVLHPLPVPPPLPHPPLPDPVPHPPLPDPVPHRLPDSAAAALFRAVAEPLLARFNPDRGSPPSPPLLIGTLTAAFTEALARTAPAGSFAARARAMLTIPGPPRADRQALDRVSLSPRFPQPMAGALTQVAQDLVLPGLDLVPPNTVVPLETNSAFVQAYLVGLNTEMGRELLWRGYPADLSATYFDRFWDATSAPGRPPDIDDISSWGGRPLGGAGSADESFVLLVRSELLRRYPDAVIYAARPGEQRDPIFTGGFAPDVRYVGFDIGVHEIGGWSIVIMEHPSAPRFGIEASTGTGTATHVAPPGASAALTAQQVRQPPVRITLPVSVLGLG
jgi:hypothetical protein